MNKLMMQMEAVITPSHLDVLSTRVRWLIQMRWVFVVLILLLCLLSAVFLPVINLRKFFILGSILAILNIAYAVIKKKAESRNNKTEQEEKALSSKQIYIFSSAQLILDYIILSFFLYYSGGIANPLIYIFLFHIIISCLLLPNILAFAIIFLSVGFFLTLSCLSQFGILPYHLFPLAGYGIMIPKPTIARFSLDAGCFVFVVALMFYFAANITLLLRRREELLRGTINELKKMGDVRMRTMMHLAHDLKAPLAAAQSSIKSVADGFAGPISEKVASILTNAYRRCHNMTAMVKDMFDLIRFDEQILRGELTTEVFSLDELVENIKDQFGSAYNGKHIEWNIKIEKEMEIYANVRQIDALLSNLVSNSIKYSGDPVNISISAEKSGADLVLSVSDGGIGIPVQEREKVLEEFYRTIPAKNMEKDGIGLGLSIVQRIVKFYNGKIGIEDGPDNKGTKFTILLSNVVGVQGQPGPGADSKRAAGRRFFEPGEESPKEIEMKW